MHDPYLCNCYSFFNIDEEPLSVEFVILEVDILENDLNYCRKVIEEKNVKEVRLTVAKHIEKNEKNKKQLGELKEFIEYCKNKKIKISEEVIIREDNKIAIGRSEITNN